MIASHSSELDMWLSYLLIVAIPFALWLWHNYNARGELAPTYIDPYEARQELLCCRYVTGQIDLDELEWWLEELYKR